MYYRTMRYHLQQCKSTLTDDNVDILASTSRWEGYLMNLEVLWIQELKPQSTPRMNTEAGHHQSSCSQHLLISDSVILNMFFLNT